jgi:membrane protease YdiL (CAAX protease family)
MKPWGIFATFGWAVLAMLAGMAVALAAFYVYFDGIPVSVEAVKYDGGAVSIEALITNTVVVLVLALASRLARWNVIDYLALIWPSGRDLALGIGVTLLLMIAMDGSSWLIGRDVVTQFQLDAYRTARATGWLPFLFAAVVIAAPVGEDVMHRGFLFRGWARSPATAPIAIVAISLLWAVLHIQYDWFGIAQIVVIGLVLGWLRWRSGSTLLTIFCHALINLGATIETVIVSDWLS